MKFIKPLIVSAVLIGLMLLASAGAWPRLGDQPIAVHFGLDGRPDGFSPKGQAVLILPGLAVVLTLLWTLLPPLMPRRGRLERSWGAYTVVWIATLGLLTVVHLALLAYALGVVFDMGRLVLIGVGALTAVIGNVMGKVRYNFVFGVRTPWTLANEQVWDRTHRFTGWLMALSGLAMVGVGAIAPADFGPARPLIILLGAIAPTVTGVVYSMLESRRVERAG